MHRRWLIPKHVGMSVLATASAIAVGYPVQGFIGFRAPLLLHTLAVAIVAQYGGLVPGLLTTVLSALFMDYFFLPPLHTLGLPPDPGDLLALILFAIVGTAISVFGWRRKRAGDEILRIRYNLETAQHIANVGSWESDFIAHRLWWSAETCRIFGVPVGTTLKIEDFYDSVHPEDRARVRENVARAIETKADYEVEHRVVRKTDGEVRHVHQQAKLIEKGGITVGLIGSIRDITEQKRAEMAEKILGGLLQVCASCRRIRDPRNDEWLSMEGYLRLRSAAQVSHGMCPDCCRQWYGKDQP